MASTNRAQPGRITPQEWIWAAYPADWIAIDKVCRGRESDDWVADNIGTRAARWLVLHMSEETRRTTKFPSHIRNSALGGVSWAAESEKQLRTVRAKEEVERARALGYPWSLIASVYQISESGAVNRFGAIPAGNLASDANRERDLWPLMLGVLTERAFPTVISDLVTQARCEGVPWKVIGSVLGKSTTNTQNKYGKGLSYRRITELNEELRWMARHACDPSMQNRFRLLAAQAARARSLRPSP